MSKLDCTQRIHDILAAIQQTSGSESDRINPEIWIWILDYFWLKLDALRRFVLCKHSPVENNTIW